MSEKVTKDVLLSLSKEALVNIILNMSKRLKKGEN